MGTDKRYAAAVDRAGVHELLLVVTDDGDRWTGLRVDKTVALRRRTQHG
ncbi:hypothetical protein [Microbacterium sp. SMR1]|nr:hypothetical protein [Microbacterium sp. SMR1]